MPVASAACVTSREWGTIKEIKKELSQFISKTAPKSNSVGFRKVQMPDFPTDSNQFPCSSGGGVESVFSEAGLELEPLWLSGAAWS